MRSRNRPEGQSDESLNSFLTRRFGAKFARLFGSALVHGIYAADSKLLSVKAAFPALLEAEERGDGSLVRGMLKGGGEKVDSFAGYDVGDVSALMKDAAIFSFVDGMETLPRALKRFLDNAPNVNVQIEASVVSLQSSTNTSDIEVRLLLLTFSFSFSILNR